MSACFGCFVFIYTLQIVYRKWIEKKENTKNDFLFVNKFSKFFKNASSANEDKIKLLSAIHDVKYSIACPEGSIINGYLWYLFIMIAFYVQRSSDGSLCDFQISL